MKIDDLKARYDSVSITNIETSIHALQAAETDSHRQYIAALFYLEHTSRYKDNKAYAHADFDTYIREVFNLSPLKYRESKLLYVKFPVEAEKYGVGYVARAAKRCGSDKLPAVFNCLRREEAKRKTPVSSEVKDAILDANAKPRPRVSYINWQERYNEAMEENTILKAELAEKDRQIAKLKATISGHSILPTRDRRAEAVC